MQLVKKYSQIVFLALAPLALLCYLLSANQFLPEYTTLAVDILALPTIAAGATFLVSYFFVLD